MTTKEINKYCKIDKGTNDILKQAVNNLNLSARAYFRILKLARTIADLEVSTNILSSHILEALSFRKKEEIY
jgi:magnesium chelatase family protein